VEKPSNFLLSKWYLDCVSRDGDVFIGYVAKLSWRALSISYASTLQYDPRRGVRSETSLRDLPAPQIKGSRIEWKHAQLSVDGFWESTAEPRSCVLLETESGKMKWNCLQPCAKVSISAGNDRIEGFGYVDHVTMTVPPWQIPFDELRWGRFLSENDAVVWIDLQGADSLNLAFHNGIQIGNSLINDSRFAANELSVSFRESVAIREGTLIKTALATVPGVGRLFPKRILQTRERKWRSRGFLSQPKRAPSMGWAIHEIVQFGKTPAI
jgi:hypothetical protein